MRRADGELRREAGHGDGVDRVVVVRVGGGGGGLQGQRVGRGGSGGEAAVGAATAAVRKVFPVQGAQALVSWLPCSLMLSDS